MSDFWKNYVYLCNKRGISTYKAAQECGTTSSGTVSNWRHGTKPNADSLNALTAFFGVTAYELLHCDLEAEDKASRNSANVANDPLYQAIAKLPANKRAIVAAFVAGLNANPDIPL